MSDDRIRLIMRIFDEDGNELGDKKLSFCQPELMAGRYKAGTRGKELFADAVVRLGMRVEYNRQRDIERQ